MAKKLCSLFLLLVLAIQVLPIRQMGSMLFGNQFTEELPHSFDTDKDCCKKETLKSDYITPTPLSVPASLIDLALHCPHFADAIPLNHTGDIHVPPPNC